MNLMRKSYSNGLFKYYRLRSAIVVVVKIENKTNYMDDGHGSPHVLNMLNN